MKIKTSDLIGDPLDWVVGKLEEEHDRRITVIRREDYVGRPIERETESDSGVYEWWSPSRIWAQGGPIMERERIELSILASQDELVMAIGVTSDGDSIVSAEGTTYLIAAMRVYVASKLGDEVDIPEELLK